MSSSTTTTPTATRLLLLLQILPISISALLAGGILTLSFITVSAVLNARTPIIPALKQYVHIYRRGSRTAPPLAAISAATSMYLAYYAHDNDNDNDDVVNGARWWRVANAALTLGIVPFTLALMGRTNGELHRREEKVRKEQGGGGGDERAAVEALGGRKWEEETVGLLEWWASLNAMRGVLPALGCLAGCIALVEGA